MTDRKQLVRQWLAGQGYNLEYFAARECRRARWHVRRGFRYQDPQEPDTWREIDLVAQRMSEYKLTRDAPLTCGLAIERKYSADSWVVFMDDPPDDARILGLGDLARDRPVFEAVRTAFTAGSPCGFATATATGNGKGSAYEALYQALKAAATIAEQTRPVTQPAVMLPIVLTNAPVFQVDYDDQGEERIEEATDVRLAVSHPLSPYPTLLDIVTRDAFPDYLARLDTTLHRVAELVRQWQLRESTTRQA